jgi:hypothetical protein
MTTAFSPASTRSAPEGAAMSAGAPTAATFPSTMETAPGRKVSPVPVCTVPAVT